jgi:ATP-dependent 26S proteasome regulatory subunit
MVRKKDKPTPPFVDTMLFDESLPVEMRIDLLRSLFASDDANARAVMMHILEVLAKGGESGEDQLARKAKELQALMEKMAEGPLRLGTFLRMVKVNGDVPRAEARLTDGSTAFSIVPDEKLAERLVTGDNIWLEANGRAVLFRDAAARQVGEEARLERQLPAGLVEVSLRDQAKSVYFASQHLLDQLDRAEAQPGDTVIVCTMRSMAFTALPREDGLSHYRYLVREPVPDVVVARDVADPPSFLFEIAEHVRTDLHDPAILARYRLRRAVMTMLSGPPGTGKSFCIMALWNTLYELMSEATGVPPEELPPRVMRFTPAKILSKWLGEADKAIDRFFQELIEIASQEYCDPQGRVWQLPVLAIFEEIDGMARERGHEAVYDRIQSTLLQRLDVCAGNRLRDLPVICVFTTNVPSLVDPAFLRRAGGTSYRFGPLESRKAFAAVLERHLRGIPVLDEDGAADEARSAGAKDGEAESPDEARATLVADVASWLFSKNGEDRGQVAITYVGRTEQKVFHRRDFLTPGLVDRAVQQAAAAASREERSGSVRPGLAVRHLARAVSDQVRAIVDRLTTHNAHHYVDVPDGMRVGTVRRMEQSPALATELERAG